MSKISFAYAAGTFLIVSLMAGSSFADEAKMDLDFRGNTVTNTEKGSIKVKSKTSGGSSVTGGGVAVIHAGAGANLKGKIRNNTVINGGKIDVSSNTSGGRSMTHGGVRVVTAVK